VISTFDAYQLGNRCLSGVLAKPHIRRSRCRAGRKRPGATGRSALNRQLRRRWAQASRRCKSERSGLSAKRSFQLRGMS
jgi:hypothetical protein